MIADLLRAGMMLVVTYDKQSDSFVAAIADPEHIDSECRQGYGQSAESYETAVARSAVSFACAGLQTDVLGQSTTYAQS